MPKRLDDLRGYLLRKKRQLTNDEDRHAHGEWIASTRVEKWNDVAVSERCKHRGMSWTESGVLAVAAYAENFRKNPPVHRVVWIPVLIWAVWVAFRFVWAAWRAIARTPDSVQLMPRRLHRSEIATSFHFSTRVLAIHSPAK